MKRTPMKRTQFGFRKMRELIPYNGRETEIRSEEIPLLKPLHRGTYASAVLVAAPKEPSPVRDERYRRLVASLPCYQCRIEGCSQAAHPNSGKAKGRKQSDLDCFPMCCTRPGILGCHAAYDRFELVPRREMAEYEAKAKEWTQAEILRLT